MDFGTLRNNSRIRLVKFSVSQINEIIWNKQALDYFTRKISKINK